MAQSLVIIHHLLCINLIKMDPSKDGKENVLIMMDAFSKFSVGVSRANQQAKQSQGPW